MKPGDKRKASVFLALGSPPRKEELIGIHEAISDRCFSNEGRIGRVRVSLFCLSCVLCFCFHCGATSFLIQWVVVPF